jgi:hypothetical protein
MTGRRLGGGKIGKKEKMDDTRRAAGRNATSQRRAQQSRAESVVPPGATPPMRMTETAEERSGEVR